MLIDLNATSENTSPFIWIHYDIDNSFSVIKSFISDVKLLVDQKERKLKEGIESLYSESSDQLDEINHRYEKIDIFINQMKKTLHDAFLNKTKYKVKKSSRMWLNSASLSYQYPYPAH